jgi:O-antigen/teichoic acid export membrane protein
VPAGLLDAGFASLATFGIGVYATRSLSPSDLGAYALFFSAFVLASAVPTQLLLAPAGIASVAHPPQDRFGLLGQMWRLGAPAAASASVTASFVALLGASAAPEVRLPLAITTALCGAISPLQDNLRMTLHLSGVSWRAASVSVVQLLSVTVVLVGCMIADVPSAWRPLGALALANAISLTFGLLTSRKQLAASALPRYAIKPLLRSGQWLLVLEMAAAVAFFVSSIVVTHLAGPEELGQAEAARIVAQPLLVMTFGLAAVLGPRSMEAGLARDITEAKHISRPFIRLLVVISAGYMVIASVPWHGNPLARLVPLAYSEPGLVLVSALGNLLLGVSFPFRYELLGAHQARHLVQVAIPAAGTQIVVSATALWVGAFARPLGLAANGAILAVGYHRYRTAFYKYGVVGRRSSEFRTRDLTD